MGRRGSKAKGEVAALPEAEQARGDPVYFVAAKAGFTPQKKLSNLFGPTEWIYHARSKFRPLSKAYHWLMEQAEMAKNRTYDTDEHFMRLINMVNPKSAKQRAAALEKGMDPNAYWQTPDGEPACGLVAKMLTGFASVARVNAQHGRLERQRPRRGAEAQAAADVPGAHWRGGACGRDPQGQGRRREEGAHQRVDVG